MSLLLLSLTAAAQDVVDPAGGWRTVRTDHYRLHYPVVAEPWAREVATQLEPIRSRVQEEVGWVPDRVVDIVVMDPFRDANGFALPLRRSPRMGVFPTPPGAEPSFGWYRGWAEELLVHEDAHLVHLLRPSRNGVMNALYGLIGVGPVATKSPAWVVEGYATVVEGRLTGMGRPNSDFRASLMRVWAAEGRMPTYGQLDGSAKWKARAVRYLVGSAYLEWLENRAGEGALRDLWARMTARKERSFDAAFEGRFGDAPATLYARFVAELTHDAIDLERARPAQEGELFLDLSRGTSPPDVADGKLVTVQRFPSGPSRMRIWKTEDDAEAETKWQEDIDELLEEDPEDVAPIRPLVLPRETEADRVSLIRPASQPRWLPDGRVLFASWQPSPGGWARPDLFTWNPETNQDKRITRGADIRVAAPHPSEPWAVGVRTRWGAQSLVRVDLESGEVTQITEPDATTVVDSPRFHPDGDRFAFVRHDGTTWTLVIRTLDGAETLVPLPEGSFPTNPDWLGDEIVVSLGTEGYLELATVTETGAVSWLTQGTSALAPAVDGDDVYFLRMDGEGYDVHRIVGAEPIQRDAATSALSIVRPPPPPPIDKPDRVPIEVDRYGMGRQEWRPLLGAQSWQGGGSLEGIVRIGDVVGRHDLILAGAVAPKKDGVDGGTLAWAYRGLPVDIEVRGFGFREGTADYRAGGTLSLQGDLRWSGGALQLQGGGWSDVAATGDGPMRMVGWSQGYLGKRFYAGRSWLGLDGEALGRLGVTGGDGWQGGRADARVRLGYDGGWLGGVISRSGTTATDPLDALTVGGVPSTVVPVELQHQRVMQPALNLPGLTGNHQLLRGELISGGGGLWWERHQLCVDLDDATCRPISVVGLSAPTEVPPLGLGRTPGLEFDLGAACIVQDFGGWRKKPCQSLDDYRAWITLAWRP